MSKDVIAEAEVKEPAQPKKPFPRSFWTANITELFERGAYYAIASLFVPYLGQLGLGEYWPSFLSSTLLWGLIYFLPILSGTIADRVGFRKALIVAFILMAVGYFLLGFPVWIGGNELSKAVSADVTAGPEVFIPVFAAIILIGMGGSVVKPCISGTVQKTAGVVKRATLGFGIFYMVINIGSLFGRGASYVMRKQFDLSYIFAVSVAFCIVALLSVIFIFKDPETERGEKIEKEKKSIGRILIDMVVVLKNKRFALFLLVSSGFFFIYNQVYNVLPIYLKRVVDLDPPVDVITMANPFVIVFFQLLITRLFGKWKPINSIVFGTVILGVAMLINLAPIWFWSDGVRTMSLGDWVPIAFVFGSLTVGLIAFGELFTSARTYEYIGALAPKGQEGLFLGYANLPMAIGAIIGGPAGALIFNEIMCRNHTVMHGEGVEGLLRLDPFWDSMGWVVLAVVAFISSLAMWTYNRWLKAHPA